MSKSSTWYEQINDAIEKRHKNCELNGESFYYKIPADVFKDHKSIAEFESRVPFNIRKDCIRPNNLSYDKDPLNRYYKNGVEKYSCRVLNGHWEPKTVARNNGFGRGTCWVSKDDAYCAQKYEVPALIRRDNDISNKIGVIADAQAVCNNDSKCRWYKSKGEGYDCVRKGAIIDDGLSVMTPPSDMPVDITDKKNHIEQYLYDWYVRKSHGTPPATTELFGNGDRCNHVPTATIEKTAKGQANINGHPKVNVLELNVNKRQDEMMLRHIMRLLNYHDIEALIIKWKRNNIKKSVYSDGLYINDEIKTLARHYQDFLADEALSINEDESNAPKPSIPQSVVNMLMKNIAGNSSTNRGIMAIHSTGSGKTCCATGVIDAFWDTNRQIIFVSSIDAIASNPDYKFHECAKNLFPRFRIGEFQGETHEESMEKIAEAFENRGIMFLPFAKLANRIIKTELFKKSLLGKPSKTSSKSKAPKPVGNVKVIKKKAKDEQPEKPRKKDAKSPKIKSPKSPKNPKKQTKETKSKKDKDVGAKPKNSKKISQDKPKAKRPRKIVHIGGSGEMPRLVKDSSMSKLMSYNEVLYPQQNKLHLYEALKKAGINGWEDFIDLDNACLIVDEVHNLFRPLATQREKHKIVEEHIVDPRRHPDMKVVIMTATPGDSIQDIMKLINIVRDPTHDIIKPPNVEDATDINRFKDNIRGLVSFFDMSNDSTKFPIVKDNGIVKYPMSNKQFLKYIDAYKDVKADYQNYELLAKKNQLAKFWSGARKYSNMLYTFEKGMRLTEFSSKLPALLDNLKRFPNDKQYVYSSFYEARGSSQGILQIAKQLDEMGYKKMTVKEAKTYFKQVSSGNNTSGADKTRETIAKLPGASKRYILAIQKEIGEEGSSTAGKNLGYLIDLFNHKENKNGKIIQVFLASQGFNEGIDLKGVRHIHFFEPLVSMASDMQTIGRARRYCSHAALDRAQGEWTVQIHRYMSDYPIDYKVKMKNSSDSVSNDVKNIEDFVYQNALAKMKELVIIQQSIKEAAVDCRILAKFHNMNSKQPFTCS
jgi:hypothetical protein